MDGIIRYNWLADGHKGPHPARESLQGNRNWNCNYQHIAITSTTVEVVLKEWMVAAGITKHITYHCSRHTTVSLAISAGADISAVKDIWDMEASLQPKFMQKWLLKRR